MHCCIYHTLLNVHIYITGMKYEQHENLCQEKISSVCQYVDCSLPEARELCPTICGKGKSIHSLFSIFPTQKLIFHA